MPSIKDIARKAGVSHCTVSRALHHSPLINAKTAERIREIARRSGYVPNQVARSLVSRSTHTVGVVVTTIADPFIGEVVEGIESIANQRGYSVILANSQADPDLEIKVVDSFTQRRVDGILVTASRVGALHGKRLAGTNVPIVLINNQRLEQPAGAQTYSVGIDNVSATRDIVGHLIQLGHRRIAYIGDSLGYHSDEERFSGYRAMLRLSRLPLDSELVLRGDGKAEQGEHAAARLLALPNPPTAIFCYNDMTALGALRAAAEHGLRVPQDVAIAGFDDLFVASYTTPPLTTIRQPKQEMGRRAMTILLDLLSGEVPETRILLPGELVVRGSTVQP
ncbi:MAG TPA: LacI family DNA-binding transcriptional regulator [Bryobacteraceae bacterium]